MAGQQRMIQEGGYRWVRRCGFNFKSRSLRRKRCGTGWDQTCRSTLLHGNSWHSLRSHSALNLCFLVVAVRLPVNKGTDNSAADAASAKGLSMTPAVSAVLAPYFKFMRRYHVFPKLTHVPGHLNTIADSLSRFKQPLPEPLTVSNHCVVRWQELLASSPVCIAQTGRKWPSKFGIDVKKALRQSADWGFPQSISFWESLRLRLVDFRFYLVPF